MVAKNIEWWITYGRLATFAIVGALTFLTAYFAADVRIDIPRPNAALDLRHPIVDAHKTYKDVPAHSDPIMIIVPALRGGILTKDYLDRLEELSARLEAVPGVMIGSVRSIISADTTTVLKSQSGPLQVPVASQRSLAEEGTWEWDFPEMQRRLVRGEHFEKWVSSDLKASLVVAELDPKFLNDGNPSAYRQIAQDFEEQIRAPLAADGYTIYVQGRPFEIADETNVWYTSRLLVIASLGFMAIGLLLMVTPRSTAFVMFCPSLAAVWAVGTGQMMGIEMTASFLVISAIVFLMGVLDGALRAHRYEDAKRKAHGPDQAAGRSLHAAFGVPLVNYLVFGFFIASWSFFQVNSLRGQALFGVVTLSFTMFSTIVLLPALLGWQGPSHPPSRGRTIRQHLKPFKTASRVVVPVVAVLFSLVLFSLAFPLPQDVKAWRMFGLTEGIAAERLNAPDVFEAWFPKSANPAVVYVETNSEGCADPQTVDYLDRLSWRLANLDGVADVQALPFEIRTMFAGWQGNDLRKVTVPVSDSALVQVLGSMNNANQLSFGCRIFPIRIFLKDRSPAIVSQVNEAVTAFQAEQSMAGVKVSAISGPTALGAVEPILSTKGIYQTWPTLIFGLLILMFAIFRDWRAPAIGVVVIGTYVAILLVIGPFGASGALPADIPVFLMSSGLAATMLVYAAGAMQGFEDDSETEKPPGLYHIMMVWWPWLATMVTMLATFWIWTLAPFELTADAGQLVFTVTSIALVLTTVAVPILWVLFGKVRLDSLMVHPHTDDNSAAQRHPHN